LPKYHFQLPHILSLLIALTLPGTAAATETIQSLQQKVDAFHASSDHQFAPSTAAKASAYLGAAMLADEESEAEKVSEGISRALALLNEARENAKRFQNRYSDLLL
jgi:hypothetical protein